MKLICENRKPLTTLTNNSSKDVWLSSKYTPVTETFERRTQQKFVSCQNKLLIKSFFQKNFLTLYHLFYCFRLFLFSWISKLKCYSVICIAISNSFSAAVSLTYILNKVTRIYKHQYMCSGIFQRFLLHTTCLRFAQTLTKSKHFENEFIYLKHFLTERFSDSFAWNQCFLKVEWFPTIRQ